MPGPIWTSPSITVNEDQGLQGLLLLIHSLLYDIDMEMPSGDLAKQSKPNLTGSIVLGKTGTIFCPCFTTVLSAGRLKLCQLFWRARLMPSSLVDQVQVWLQGSIFRTAIAHASLQHLYLFAAFWDPRLIALTVSFIGYYFWYILKNNFYWSF